MAERRLLYVFCGIFYGMLCRESAAQGCQVNNLAVQADFNFDRYLGKWYEVSRYSANTVTTSILLSDYTQHYIQTDATTATVYAQGRKPLDQNQCENAAYNLTSTETPGKLLFTSDGLTAPHWVLETDYSQYAFVYGCHNVSNNGTCIAATASIWSRTQNLSQSVTNRAFTFYQTICIPESSFETVVHSKECPLTPIWNLKNERDCTVDRFEIQPNFDINKYAGTWYETRWLAPFFIPANQLFQDYQHHYVITGEGNITGYVYGRSPDNPDQCFYNDVTLLKTPIPGKFFYKYKMEALVPYWVIRTDYTQYAVVFGCFNVSSDGSCHQARSWVWSRTPSIPKHLEYEVNTLLQNICVNPSAFLATEQTKLCPVKPIWNLNDEKDCTVDNFDVQANFDISMYAGTWYETKWLAPFAIPANQLFQDYQHHYVITGDGNISGYIYGRSPDNPDQCFYNYATLLKTQTPGKLFYKYRDEAPIPYWVIRTDYTQYAVVFGCFNVSSDSSCHQARSWVWSRTPSLPKHLEYEVNTLLQNICTNPSAFLATEQNNLCPLKPIWNLDNKQDCNVTSFNIKSNFDVKKFSRVWYETRWLPKVYQTQSDLSTDYQEEIHVNDQGDLKSYTRYRKGSGCKYGTKMYMKTDTPGKFKFGQSSQESYDLWVADTDYETYAVMYGCERIGTNEGCVSARALVWSRKPTLTQSLQYHANTVLQGFCVNPSALVNTAHNQACPPETVKECSKDPVSSASVCGSSIGHLFIYLLIVTLLRC